MTRTDRTEAMRRRFIIALAWLGTPLGCATIAGLEDHRPYPAEAGAGVEGGAVMDGSADGTMPGPDAPTSDDGGLPVEAGGPVTDAGADGAVEAAVPTNYSALSDSSKWEFFDVAPLPKTSGFMGGAVVGNFVYFASNARSLLRYDTTTPFASETSWSVMSNSTIPASNTGLAALGQFVYVAPLYEGYVVGRYDTTQPFDGGASAYGAHEPASESYVLFQGACTDGHIVYFVPYQYYDGTNAAYVGSLLTYDPNGAGFFTDSSWTVTSLASFNPNAVGMAECVYDGKYVYFGNNRTGTTARYDTTQPISMSTSWVFFQVNQIDPNLYGYNGMIYTGRYVVYVPSYSSAYSAAAVAYDTQNKFGEVGSWTPYYLTSTDGGASAAGYAGGQFDGRYVYLAPTQTGLVMRWDSTMSFSDPAAWEAFNINALHPGATGFVGTAFDGQYVYFSTNAGSAMARFKARDTVGRPSPQSSFF
jgi:hypothetical protein